MDSTTPNGETTTSGATAVKKSEHSKHAVSIAADDVSNAEVTDISRAKNFEEILFVCCGMGRWQALLILYMSLMWLILPFFSMSMMFIGGSPPFKCADGFDANATYNDLPDDTPECVQSANASVTCTRWVWDHTLYQSTVVTEWGLVCARKPLLSLLQSILMMGGLVGAICAGQLADRIGRRPVFLPSMLLIVLVAFASAAVVDYEMFVVCRFLSGLAMAGMIGSQYILTMELSSFGPRACITAVSLFPFTVGTMLVAAGSYWIRTRRLLQLAYAVPCLALLPNVFIMPESPRWLLLQGRMDEAYAVLERGARWNRKQMPDRDVVITAMARIQDKDLARQVAVAGEEGDTQYIRLMNKVKQLFRTPQMRKNILISAFTWFVVSGTYFGIAFDTTQLSPHPHLVGVFVGLSDLPCSVAFLVINRLGRHRPIAACFVLTAVAMFLIVAFKDASARIALGLIGKVFIGLAFTSMYTYTPEYLPTSVRGIGFGLCQVMLRLGAAVSPFVVDMVSDLHQSAPTAVFGVFSLTAGLAFLLLPETMGMRMPETVADVEEGLQKEVNPEGR